MCKALDNVAAFLLYIQLTMKCCLSNKDVHAERTLGTLETWNPQQYKLCKHIKISSNYLFQFSALFEYDSVTFLLTLTSLTKIVYHLDGVGCYDFDNYYHTS